MKFKREYCEACGEETYHRDIGMVPSKIINGDGVPSWVRAAVCNNCGSLTVVEPTEEQLERAEERYMSALKDTGLLSEQEYQTIIEG